MSFTSRQPGPHGLPPELTRDIERAGYYPALVRDVVGTALAGDEVVSHLVHQETSFDHVSVRRHVTVLVLTTTRLVVAHAFAATDLHRIELEVYAFNPRAQHVYARAGFVVEGRRRDAFVFDGERVDAVLMAVLRRETDLSERS